VREGIICTVNIMGDYRAKGAVRQISIHPCIDPSVVYLDGGAIGGFRDIETQSAHRGKRRITGLVAGVNGMIFRAAGEGAYREVKTV